MKSFVAADMRSALRMVREELGDDAVILSNRRVANGIELLAAADMPPPAPALPTRPREREERAAAPAQAEAPAAAGSQEAPRASAAGVDLGRANAESAAHSYPETSHSTRNDDGGFWQMQQELRSMRDLIETQYTNFAWQQFRGQQPAQAAMWRRLQRLGLDLERVRDLLEGGGAPLDLTNSKAAWQVLMARLSAKMPVAATDLVAQGGVFAFVGPTGSGKTTTVAKLAARYVLEHGNADVALITTDSYRIGAHEQLRTLSRILNVPCKVAGAGRDLGDLLYELRHCKLVLIDTAGVNTKAPELREQLGAIEALGERARCFQVLAVNSQQQALQAAQKAYQTSNLAGCIFTKVDEAGSLGEAISLLIKAQLPLCYVADGQAIPGDIASADAKQLITRAIALAKQAEHDEERLAQAFVAGGGNRPVKTEKALSA